MDAAQRALLAACAALGLAQPLHGQPAWPFGQRIATEVLAIDRALARQFFLSATALGGALLLLGASAAWRRGRRALWVCAGLALLLAPWPQASLVFTAAVPTSFHRSPTAFGAQSIAEGAAQFEHHCAGCHGASGRGDGPQAAAQGVWPPDLTGALLWRRLEGELLWRLLQGMQDRAGRPSMPGFAGALSVQQAWAVLDHLQAQAAGSSLQREGIWAQPVPLPDAPVQCDGRAPRALRGWPGQRVRVVAVDAPGAAVAEDPRLVTVALTRTGAPAGLQAECRLGSDAAWAAFARLAGVPPAALGGTQFIADRQGWLRARAVPGQGGWSAADLVCRAGDTPLKTLHRGGAGLDALVAQMDAQGVRYVRGGVAH